ncbi:unnamed protein product, partial [marine sediment metagenome]
MLQGNSRNQNIFKHSTLGQQVVHLKYETNLTVPHCRELSIREMREVLAVQSD